MENNMTPQEIADYKQKWMASGNNNPSRIHSDFDVQAKDWCRRHLERWQWSMQTWTNVYEHTFFFEDEEKAKEFRQNFSEWILTK
jgi:hypothetical protein